jgi:cobalamin-dependent methionine synthase I
MECLNTGVLFKSRWKLDDKEAQENLERIIEEYEVGKIDVVFEKRTLFQAEFSEFAVQMGKRMPEIAVFAVTVGSEPSKVSKRLYEEGSYFDYYLFHGLMAELVEAGAEWIEQKVRNEMSLAKTRRISPGYPAWPKIEDQEKLLSLLDGEKLGITLTSSFQLIPEHSITGAVVDISQIG